MYNDASVIDKVETADPFTVEDIEDCKIIIKAKRKHWSIIPTPGISTRDARECRIGLARLALMVHGIVDCPLEDKGRIKAEIERRKKQIAWGRLPWQNAGAIVELHGHHLIGCEIETQAQGSWAGGVATVMKIKPDPAAPDIRLHVKNEAGKEFGVFYNESIRFEPYNIAKQSPVGKIPLDNKRQV